jgi:hypothetical protein
MFRWLFGRNNPEKTKKVYTTPETQRAAEEAVAKETEEYSHVMTNSIRIEELVTKLREQKDIDIDYFGYLIEASMKGKIDVK